MVSSENVACAMKSNFQAFWNNSQFPRLLGPKWDPLHIAVRIMPCCRVTNIGSRIRPVCRGIQFEDLSIVELRRQMVLSERSMFIVVVVLGNSLGIYRISSSRAGETLQMAWKQETME